MQSETFQPRLIPLPGGEGAVLRAAASSCRAEPLISCTPAQISVPRPGAIAPGVLALGVHLRNVRFHVEHRPVHPLRPSSLALHYERAL